MLLQDGNKLSPQVHKLSTPPPATPRSGPDLGKPSVPMLSAAMSGSSLRPENTFCILIPQSAPKPSEFRVQGLYEPTHGKPTKIAYKPLYATWARLNTHDTIPRTYLVHFSDVARCFPFARIVAFRFEPL